MNYYETLGLTEGATKAEVQEAYRRFVRKYHPDHNPGDPHAAGVFKRVQEAYDAIMGGKASQTSSRQGTHQQADTGYHRTHSRQQSNTHQETHSQKTEQEEPRFTRAEWHELEGEWFKELTEKEVRKVVRRTRHYLGLMQPPAWYNGQLSPGQFWGLVATFVGLFFLFCYLGWIPL